MAARSLGLLLPPRTIFPATPPPFPMARATSIAKPMMQRATRPLQPARLSQSAMQPWHRCSLSGREISMGPVQIKLLPTPSWRITRATSSWPDNSVAPSTLAVALCPASAATSAGMRLWRSTLLAANIYGLKPTAVRRTSRFMDWRSIVQTMSSLRVAFPARSVLGRRR